MKVTKVETIRTPEHPNLLWVQLHTDEGIIGLGETTPRVMGAETIIHDILADILLGQDPLHIEKLWHDMYQSAHYHGYAGSEMRAISAIDLALWDILGKYTNQPLYRLLGGKCRESIRVYNTCVSHGAYNDWELSRKKPGELAESLLKDGITAMKIWPYDQFSEKTRGHSISNADLQKGVSAFKQIREAVGDEIEIALEGHACWNVPSAIRIAQAVEPYRPMWLEDLIAVDSISSLKELKEATSTPLCVSERLFSRFQFMPVLEQRAATIIMPDICWVGGISEIKKIATLASAYQLPIAPHNCGGPVQTIAYSHVCTSTENVMIVETVRAFYRSYYEALVTEQPVIKEGHLYPLESPGLGTELSPSLLKRDDLIRKVSTQKSTTIGWTSGDPWEGEVGNHF
ncbi:mandelate racemase/muconate lactonizing enzyme family protein [Halalkalibacter oceani]|uniref:mandelate racemase/muconate lactonizing enzyme family protein n=1 Tax=Halalkalibacter oceani TaxID=1653776 RepID=UPI0033963C01